MNKKILLGAMALSMAPTFALIQTRLSEVKAKLADLKNVRAHLSNAIQLKDDIGMAMKELGVQGGNDDHQNMAEIDTKIADTEKALAELDAKGTETAA